MVAASITGISARAGPVGSGMPWLQAPAQHGSPVAGTHDDPDPRHAGGLPSGSPPASFIVQQIWPQLSVHVLELLVWKVQPPASQGHVTVWPQTSNVPHPPVLHGLYGRQQLPWLQTPPLQGSWQETQLLHWSCLIVPLQKPAHAAAGSGTQLPPPSAGHGAPHDTQTPQVGSICCPQLCAPQVAGALV
jgi:hypothetical protein